MAAIQPGAWGIDVGQCALKAVRLQRVGEQVVATAFDYVEHPKILNQPDADPDQLTREALEKFLSRNHLRGDTIAMSVPGQAGLARFVKLPPVEEKKITDIVRFEARQQIPFNLNEVVWDYQRIGSGQVTDGFAMETEIGLFAIKRDMINKYLQHFKDVNVEVQIVQMAPLALCNFVSYDLLGKEGLAGQPGVEGDRECIVGVDIGTDSTNLIITDGDRIIWQRPIPIGGNHFTRALTKDMKLTFAKAEHLKRNATKSPDLKKILTALKPVLNDFVSEVQRSLGFFTNTHRDATIQYLIGLGGAFRLPGLQKFLSEKLQLDVRRLQKFERLDGDAVTTAPAFTENLLSFATAYGLALQGLKLPRLQTNLLPPEIQMARLIRSKKPWAVTAATLLLIGTAVLTFGYSREHIAVASPLIDKARSEGKTVASTVESWKKKCELKKAEISTLEVAVKSVLTGQDERINWLQLHKFINDALPRPDGANLTDEQKLAFWQDPANNQKARGKEAYEAMLAAQKDDTRTFDNDFRENLIQANIEAVNCRFSDNLERVFDKLRTQERLPSELKADLPKGAGWLVEIRGFTYHKEPNFLKDTLVRNIVEKAREEKKTTPTPTEAPADPLDKPADAALEDPIKGKISHVFIHTTLGVSNAAPNEFKLINTSALPALFPSASGDSSGPVPGQGIAQPRDRWRPLGGVGTTLETTTPRPVAEIPSTTPMPDKQPTVKPGDRTEFIIMFVWREPTPSDQLMTAGSEQQTPPTQGASGGSRSGRSRP